MGNEKIAVVGDLHLSDRAVGRYIDYFANCMEVCGQITNMLTHEHVTRLILAGDVIGVGDTCNFKTQGGRLAVIQLFRQWNVLCRGHVYSLCGNHDTGASIGDFEILKGADLVKCPSDVEVGGFKFHLVNYGEDNRELAVDPNLVNVAVTHSFFRIENQTNYIPVPGGTELSDMLNFSGVQVVANGHIHYPSNGYMQTSISGRDVSLINLGSPTRPSASETYMSVPVMLFESVENNGGYDTNETVAMLNLRDKAELYTMEKPSAEVAVSSAKEEIANIEELNKILQEVTEIGVNAQLSYKDQLARFSNNNSRAVDIAYKYIEMAQAKFNGEMPTSEAKPKL